MLVVALAEPEGPVEEPSKAAATIVVTRTAEATGTCLQQGSVGRVAAVASRMEWRDARLEAAKTAARTCWSCWVGSRSS